MRTTEGMDMLEWDGQDRNKDVYGKLPQLQNSGKMPHVTKREDNTQCRKMDFMI